MAGSAKAELTFTDDTAGGAFHCAAELLGHFDLWKIDHILTAGADEVDMGTDIAIETLDAAYGAQALDQTLLLEEGQISVHRCNGDIRMICLEHLMEFFR